MLIIPYILPISANFVCFFFGRNWDIDTVVDRICKNPEKLKTDGGG